MNRLSHLNEAQKRAVSHAKGPLLILAGAGSGKTRVIVHRIAELIAGGTAPEKILAVTFTNKAAGEMRERVRKILGSDLALSPYDSPKTEPFLGTFHGLSLHIIKTFHKHAGLPARFTIYDRQDSTKVLKEAIRSVGFDPKELEPRRVLSVMGRHKGNAVSLEEFRNEHTSSYIDEAIAEVWEKYAATLKKEKALDFDDILVVAHELLTKHDDAREFFQNAWEYLHVDEYQDTNRIQYEIVKALAEKHKNLCVVGDGDQCVAKGTAITMADGSKKPVQDVRVGDLVLSNYGSGDARPARVSMTRARKNRRELVRITTKNGRALTTTPDHTHFAGYQLGVTPQQYYVYLMHKRGAGWRLGVSQTYTRGQRKPMIGFQQRCNQEHADEVWVLETHTTMNDARIAEYKLSLAHQIPTVPFVARKGGSIGGYAHDQNALDAIFAAFDTDTAAHALLRKKTLSPSHPHHRAQTAAGRRKNIVITLCGDRRGASPMHRISIAGNEHAEARMAQRAGFSVRPARKNSTAWRCESAYRAYADALAHAEAMKRLFPDARVVERARLGGQKKNPKDGNSLPFLPATSVRPGMAMFDEHGAWDIVEKTEQVFDGVNTVYDLDIENTHNFIGNGLVTHNCIYSWRGASLEHILNFERDFPGATVVPLVENYRSTKNIIAAANDAIAKNVQRQEKELFTKNIDGERILVAGLFNESAEAAFVAAEARRRIRAKEKAEDIAVLYRANFQSRILEEAFLQANVPYQVLGTRFFERKEIKDILAYIRLAFNPESVADFTRAISTPSRGIGKVTLAKIVQGQEHLLPPTARGKLEAFRETIRKIKEATEKQKSSDAIRFALKESGMVRLYEHGQSEDTERLENLKELVTVATKYDGLDTGAGIEKLLEEAALQSDQDELARPKEGVKLMTVHAAKGLEFETVFVTGLEDGLFPHERDSGDGVDEEEERRLFYVALTRAKKRAILTYAATRLVFGNRSVNTASEFITELDPNLVDIVAYPIGGDEIPIT